MLGFIVTPLLIRYLGKDDFSLYKLTFDWLSSIGFLEQALTSSILAFLVEASNEKRDHITYYAYKKYYRISIFFLALTICLIPFLPYLYAIPVDKLTEVRIGFFIGSLTFLFLPLTVLRLWIEFHEKSYLLNSSRMIQNIFQSIMAILLAWMAFGIIGQFSAVLMGQFLFALIVFSLFKKSSSLLPHHKLEKKEEIEFNQKMWVTNKKGLILSLTSKLSFFSDTLLLGFFFKPVLILPFTLTQKLVQMIQENLQSIGNSSWASLIDLYRNGKQEEFEAQLISLTRIVVFLSFSLCLPLLFLNRSFIFLWVGEQFYAGFLVTLVAILNAYFMSIFSLWGWCLSGNGKISIQIPIYLLNAVINFSTGLLFIKLSGIIGPILGTLAGFLIAYSWLIPRALHSEMKVNKMKLYKNLFAPLTIFIPMALVSWQYETKFLVENYLSWGIHFILLSGIISSLLYIIYLNSGERLFLKNIFLKKFRF